MPFEGIALTDTFQLTEDGDLKDEVVFPANNARAENLLDLDIRVMIGNPPYSVGQNSGNDDNANISYPTLDAKIRDTFAAKTTATNKNSLYDSYMRAIRWASDKIGDEGVIGFVTNGGWIEGNTAAGVRKTLAEEFSSIYVFNLRGNARTAGETARKEGGNVFNVRVGAAVFLLVRTKNHGGTARIHYRDIGDYFTREQKLSIVSESNLDSIPWRTIIPNEFGDWINQRDPHYLEYPILAAEKDRSTVFTTVTAGLQTNRDAWVYNSSDIRLSENLAKFIDTYNRERASFAQHAQNARIDTPKGSDTVGIVTNDETRIKWNRSLRDFLAKGRPVTRQQGRASLALYRPFYVQHIDHSDGLVYLPAVARRYFPTAAHVNYGFYVTGVGSDKDFSALATRLVPDLALWGSSNGQFFPRYSWEPVGEANDGGFDLAGLSASPDEVIVDGYRRVDAISDEYLKLARKHWGEEVSKDDVFYFLYGLLHSPEYRERYAGELKQMLPRVPWVPSASFQGFTAAGRELFTLHADYETQPRYPLTVVQGDQPQLGGEFEYYRVQKMRFANGKKPQDAPESIVYNDHITVTGIPEAAYRYQLGSRSAIEWVIRQYQVSTDAKSGIVNDPNDWAAEHNDPRYILDLLEKVVHISVRTVEITDSLPGLE